MSSVVPVKAIQPVPAIDAAVSRADGFKVGLCDCCDSEVCCMVCFCPSCVVGANGKMIKTGKLVDACCGCGSLCCCHFCVGYLAGIYLGPCSAIVSCQ